MSSLRRPSVAGAFYPSDRTELGNMLSQLFSQSPVRPVQGDLLGLMVPHAGYVYSGIPAATGYKLLKGKEIDTVIIFGPSHRLPFSGIAVYPDGAWETPLGIVEIDEELTGQLASKSKAFLTSILYHEGEHSIEVQIPFLQFVLGEDFKIVPLLVGSVSLPTLLEAGDVLAQVLAERKNWVIIMSSDLYHGYSYDECRLFDSRTISTIMDLDEEQIYNSAVRGEIEACGIMGVVAGIRALKKSGVSSAELLLYTNSAEVTGAFTGYVVGYASIAFVKASEGSEEPELTEEEKRELLEIAKRSVEAAVRGEPAPEFEPKSPRLRENWGVFVTLKKHGQLRGCIGYVIGFKPLYEATRDVAISAALNDPRFPPVTPDELPELSYEISVLTPPRRITDVDEIVIGKHGLLIKQGPFQGLLLPQVATEHNMSREEFLDHTCLKAGLPPGCWRSPETEIYVFTALVFGDEEA